MEDDDQGVMEVASIRITKIIGDGGKLGTNYSIDGMNTHEAMGTLEAVHDIIRARELQGWGSGA